MIKIIGCLFLLSTIFLFSVGEAAKPQDKKDAIVVTGGLRGFKSVVENEKARQRANQRKVVTDPNLKILSNLLFAKEEIWQLPKDYKKITIAGRATVTRSQAIAFIKRYNFTLPLDVTPEEMVTLYQEEAGLEKLKWDIALCQALVETGFFTFGGTVVPEQNNFCGLGTTSATVRGAYFLTPREGVRAHVQHLLAYTSKEKPALPIVDPRYNLVYDGKLKEGFFSCWSQLNGKWATGSEYAEKILNLHQQMEKVIAVHS